VSWPVLLLVACVTGSADTPDGHAEAPAGEVRSEAERLYREGVVRYEAADYAGAIDRFTRALDLVIEQEGAPEVRLRLLYNIAVAHERAYEIDQDVTRLRKAQVLYRRYLSFAQETADRAARADVEQRLARIEAALAKTEVQDDVVDRKGRGAGAALAAAGGGVLAVGVGLAVAGGTFAGRAQDRVDGFFAANPVPDDHPARAEGEAYVDEQRRRGRTWMIAGGVLAGVGAGATVAGVVLLVRRRPRSRLAVAPLFGGRVAGAVVSGRF